MKSKLSIDNSPAAGKDNILPGRSLVLHSATPRFFNVRFSATNILLCCCALTALLSCWALRQEMLVSSYQAKLDRQATAPPGSVTFHSTDLPFGAPPRVLLAEALYLAQIAAPLPDIPARASHLRRATRYLAQLEHVRPHWAQLWIAKAYILSLSSRRFSVEERDALVRSYIDAGYLQDAGRWRVFRALENWDHFPAFTQDRIVRETLWLYKISSGDNMELIAAVRKSGAYVPVFMALRRSAN